MHYNWLTANETREWINWSVRSREVENDAEKKSICVVLLIYFVVYLLGWSPKQRAPSCTVDRADFGGSQTIRKDLRVIGAPWPYRKRYKKVFDVYSRPIVSVFHHELILNLNFSRCTSNFCCSHLFTQSPISKLKLMKLLKICLGSIDSFLRPFCTG